MSRRSMALLAIVAALLAATIPFAAAAPESGGPLAGGHPALQDRGNETTGNGSVAPGATLTGALGSEQAEIGGEFERRSFDHALAGAASTSARASTVADRLEAVEERLAELEARQERLETLRENGSISDAEFQARMTVLAAQARSLDRLGSRAVVYANGVPTAALAERGVTPDQVDNLQARAATLSSFDRDLFAGTYGNHTLPEGGLDEPFSGGTPQDFGWNATTPEGTTGDGTAFDWNVTENSSDDLDLNTTLGNGTDP